MVVLVFVAPLMVFELRPPLSLVLVLILAMVLGGVKVTRLESRHSALPAASRAQVLPTGQQKVSPGHSTVDLSAHPGLVVVQQRFINMFTGLTHQRGYQNKSDRWGSTQ